MSKDKFTKKEEVINYINNDLKQYQGYIQFSHRAIDLKKDIFPVIENIENEQGFVYEAHFCNDVESITIRQVNANWLVSITDISSVDNAEIQKYISDIKDFNYKVKMAQIWESKADELCEGMEVKKLSKVVFAGFEKGDLK